MKKRVVSQADVDAAFTVIIDMALTIFNQLGSHSPALYAIKMHDDEAKVEGITHLDLDLIASFHASAAGKDRMMEYIKNLLRNEMVRSAMMKNGLIRPDLVVHVSETWRTKNLKFAERVSQDPERTEGVSIVVHTQLGSTIRSCEIDPVTRKASSPLENDIIGFAGRMQLARTDDEDVGDAPRQ